MPSSPRVSVVMPVLNGAKHLRESIETVRAQTYQDWELIVVNDGSTDNTSKILDEYVERDPRIRVITHQKKMGLAPAINDGLTAARGELIARLDGDDLALPHRFARQVEFLDQHKNIYLVGGGYAAFNEQGHRMNIFHPSSSLDLAWSFLTDTRFCHPTVMFRKSALEKIGLYPTTGAEDFAFFSKFVQAFPCVNLPEILIRYREHDSNYSITAKPHILTSVQETYRANFRHYIGDDHGVEMFYRYHTQNKLTLANLWRVMQINHRILWVARQQYGILWYAPSLLQLNWRLLVKNLRSLVGTFLLQITTKSSRL